MNSCFIPARPAGPRLILCTVIDHPWHLNITAILTFEGCASQAEKEAGPPTEEEKVGTWFSNPAAEHSTQAQRTGVGKYLNAQAVRKAEGLSADVQVGSAPGPPAKKAKQAFYGNFDAW